MSVQSEHVPKISLTNPKCTPNPVCACVSGLCSAGCGNSGNGWSTGGSKCSTSSQVTWVKLNFSKLFSLEIFPLNVP